MKKIITAMWLGLSIALTGCTAIVQKPIEDTFSCKTDCSREIRNMENYAGKFAYYQITKSTKNGFSASQNNLPSEAIYFRGGYTTYSYIDVWKEGSTLKVVAMNNGQNDQQLLAELYREKDHDWGSEVVHKGQSTIIDERRLMVAPLFENF